MHSSDIKDVPGYESLLHVLIRAYDQAAKGKGAERHADNRPFTEQPMQSISGLLGSDTGLLYQAMKKIQESQRLDQDAAVRELLGAIVYIAGSIVFKEGKQLELQLKGESHADKVLKRAGYAPEKFAQGPKVNPLNTIHAPISPVQGPETHWLCYHGNTDVPGKSVRIGEACPVCYATSK